MPNQSAQTKKTIRLFTFLYIVALSIIAMFSIFSQSLIQDYLSSQLDDSRLLNFSAKLRTYCQMLSKTALLLERGEDEDSNRKEFLNTLKQWEASHKGLLSGNDFLDLPTNDREDLEQMYAIIDGPYKKIVTAASAMIEELYHPSSDSLSISPYVKTILEYEKSYLLGMELIVFDYDRFSRNSVKELKHVEYTLLYIVLVTLLLEAGLIFYPLSRKINHIFKGLSESETNALQLADELSIANETLEKSHRELREINFALEKATYLVKTDAEGKIIYANDKYCHVTKYNMSELINKPIFYNNMGSQESIIYSHIKDSIRNKEVWQGEVYDHASDGTGFWLDVTLIPIINQKGKLYQYLLVCNDVTKRKNTERTLNLLMEEQLRRQHIEQKIKSYSIILGQERERKRVAAEIHDGIGQMLTSLRMRIEILEKENDHIDAHNIQQVHKLLQSIIDETRRISSDLLPNVLDDFGLKVTLQEIIKGIRETSKIEVSLEENLNLEHIKKEVEIGVYRIIQESINNIIKHADATEISIHVDNNHEYLNLLIQDNGIGFFYDNERLYQTEMREKNNGLRNMKERAELLGGDLNITSEPGKGTIIQLEISL